MQVRCLVSARNAGETFDLRCEVREKMVQWLREAHPGALPRDRVAFEERFQDGERSERRRRDLAPPPSILASPVLRLGQVVERRRAARRRCLAGGDFPGRGV